MVASIFGSLKQTQMGEIHEQSFKIIITCFIYVIMFKNTTLLLFILLTSIYLLISWSFFYSTWINIAYIEIIPFFIIPLIILIYILYIFIKWIYQKKISKNYIFSYLSFLVLLVIFYFSYYTNSSNILLISENSFETKLQNIEIKNEDNWLIALWILFKENSDNNKKLSEIYKNLQNNYNCIISNNWINCKNEVLKDKLLFYKNNNDIINKLDIEIKKIVKSTYFKESIIENQGLNWITTLSRINLYSVINKLQEWNTNEAIDSLLLYKKLWDRILGWDTWIINFLIWSSIISISNQNINYIIDNYTLDKKSLDFLKNELSNNYNSKEILSNVIKFEYQLNKNYYDKNFANNSLIYNSVEFYSLQRTTLDYLINWWDKDFYKNNTTNYLKRTFVYWFLWKPIYDIKWYKDQIEKINIERKNILNKISKK